MWIVKQNMKCIKKQNLIEDYCVEVGIEQGMEKWVEGGEWGCHTTIMTAMLTLYNRQGNGPQEVYILIPGTFEQIILHGKEELGYTGNSRIKVADWLALMSACIIHLSPM